MDKATFYTIRVKSHLDSNSADWFAGLTITNDQNGEAVLTGYLLDQAALFGVLNRINNLGLELISVNPVLEED
jgi:hypothetical protein